MKKASISGRPHGDDGIGMLAVVWIGAVLLALITTVAATTMYSVATTDRDRHATSALGAAEAGVAQAVQYLRGTHLGLLQCDVADPTSAACTSASPSWSSSSSPMAFTMDSTTVDECDGTQPCAEVWIGVVSAYEAQCPARTVDPTQECSGVYRIHSKGVSGNGPSSRRVTVDVEVSPFSYPMGIFSKDDVGSSGNIDVRGQSVFTMGNVYDRVEDGKDIGGGLQFAVGGDGLPVKDLIYGGRISAKAVGSIYAGKGNNQKILTGACPDAEFPYDRSGDGSGDCSFNSAEMTALGYLDRGLTEDQYQDLKAQAIAQGTYNIPGGQVDDALATVEAAGIMSPVLYWDVGTKTTGQHDVVELKESDFGTTWRRPYNDAQCGPGLIIIVDGPDLKYQGASNSQEGSEWLSAAIFVPEGNFEPSGGPSIIGTVFADEIDFAGDVDFHMDECFANNPPGSILSVRTIDWREIDSVDVD